MHREHQELPGARILARSGARGITGVGHTGYAGITRTRADAGQAPGRHVATFMGFPMSCDGSRAEARRNPGATRQEIEQQTLDYMATMPAWRDHPRVTRRGG